MSEAAKTEKPKHDQKGKTKHRSPNYPAVGLRKALDRAAELRTAYKRQAVPLGLAFSVWKYKENSGAAIQLISALKSYGLVVVEGEGPKRTVKISEVAYMILEQHPDRTQLLKQSALGPKIYAELWAKYGASGLPPDDLLRHYLKWERHFNPEVIDGLIADFRDTVAFANLVSSDKMSGVPSAEEQSDEADDETNGDDMEAATLNPDVRGDGQQEKPKGQPRVPARDVPPEDWVGPTVGLDLPRGNRIEIRLRSKVTAAEFEKIKKVYDLSELSFVEGDDDNEAA